MNPATRKLLEQILMFAKRTQERTRNVSLEAFLNDELLQDAVLYCLGQMGETASRIPDEEQDKYPEMFWNQMISLRHRVFHRYEALNLSIVYGITQEAVARLVESLERLLRLQALQRSDSK